MNSSWKSRCKQHSLNDLQLTWMRNCLTNFSPFSFKKWIDLQHPTVWHSTIGHSNMVWWLLRRDRHSSVRANCLSATIYDFIKNTLTFPYRYWAHLTVHPKLFAVFTCTFISAYTPNEFKRKKKRQREDSLMLTNDMPCGSSIIHGLYNNKTTTFRHWTTDKLF